jgi:2-oxoglutarate ferredoxin oxidoreductase subunit delta
MPRVLEMTDERNAKGYVVPRLLDGCTGCRACADVCPDYVFEVYRFDHSDDRVPVGTATDDAPEAS